MKLRQGVLSKKPYRDSALVYGGFAIAVVVIVGLTGGPLFAAPRIEDDDHIVVGAVPVAAVCFLIATGYSWWRIRERLAAEDDDT